MTFQGIQKDRMINSVISRALLVITALLLISGFRFFVYTNGIFIFENECASENLGSVLSLVWTQSGNSCYSYILMEDSVLSGNLGSFLCLKDQPLH